MSGERLYDRKWRVVVGAAGLAGVDVSELRCVFAVAKSSKPEPNTCELQVYGLSRSSQAIIEAGSGGQIPVSIEAGYQDAFGSVFLGHVRHASTRREGADLITTIGAGDGEKGYQTGRANLSFKPNTSADEVLRKLAAALGVSPGNLTSAAIKLKLAGLGTLFSSGTVLTGSASRELTAVCRSCGLGWSVQDGALQLLPIGQALAGTAVLVSPETGLVGSPTVNGKGVLSCRTLMIPDLFPGRKVVVESEHVRGNFVAVETTHTGDTEGQEWYVDIEGKPL